MNKTLFFGLNSNWTFPNKAFNVVVGLKKDNPK